MYSAKLFSDITISGGGIVGSACALYLAQQGFKVILINDRKLFTVQDQTPDLRVLAINHGSVDFLSKMGVFNYINSNFYLFYDKLEVWEDSYSKLEFNASSLYLPNMGLIIEYQRLQKAIWDILNTLDTSIILSPESLKYIHYNGIYWDIILEGDISINTNLLIGADGINSVVRKLANIKVNSKQYNQYCMVFIVKIEKFHSNTIWQMFTPSGPKSCLPLYDNWASLMWYDSIERINKLKSMSFSNLEKEVQNVFMKKLGKIKLYKITSFPLFCQYAQVYIKPGLALIGDSAHSIHPLAGQGSNLGIRDAELLAKMLVIAKYQKRSWNSLDLLQTYQKYRKYDNFLMQSIVDLLYFIFTNDIKSIKVARNIGLLIIHRSEWLKKYILKYALGI